MMMLWHEEDEGLNWHYMKKAPIQSWAQWFLYLMLNRFNSQASCSKTIFFYVAYSPWGLGLLTLLGWLGFATRGTCHFVIITGFCMRIKSNLSPYWVIQEVCSEEEEQECGCEEIHFRQKGWKVKWVFRNGGSGSLSRLDCMLKHTHTRAHARAHVHTPPTFHGSQGIAANEGLVHCCAYSHHCVPGNEEKPQTAIKRFHGQRNGQTNNVISV